MTPGFSTQVVVAVRGFFRSPRYSIGFAAALVATSMAWAPVPMALASTPTFTVAGNIFPSVSLGHSTAQNVTVTLNKAVALKSIALQTGFSEYKLGTISGCVLDGTTVNAAATVCTIPVTFTPTALGSTAAVSTARTAPLLVTDLESANPVVYSFGLLGAASGPVMQFTPATLTRVAGVAATGFPAGDQGLGIVTSGYAGDNGPATSASFAFLNVFSVFDEPAQPMAVDSAGNIYVVDLQNQIIRRIDGTTNIVTTVVGIPKKYARSGDGGPATSAAIEIPASLALDAVGNVYFSDAGTASTDGGFTIRMVNAATGIVNSIAGQNLVLPYAGTGTCVVAGQGYQWEPTCGDGGLATDAFLYNPQAIAIDGAGNVYILEEQGTIRRIDAITGIITSVGNAIPSGVGQAFGMAMGADGNLYASLDDSNNPGEYLTQTDPATGKTKVVAGGATTQSNTTCTEQGSIATDWFLGFNEGYTAGLSADGAGNIYGSTGECLDGTVNFRYNTASGLAYAFTNNTGGGNGGQNGAFYSFGGAYGIQPAFSVADGAGNIYIQTYNQIARLSGSVGALNGYGDRYDYQTDAAGTECDQFAGSFCETAVISNVGNEPLNIDLTLSAGFTFLTNGDSSACVAGTVNPGDFCNLDVEFTPVTAGTVNGTLTLNDNATTQSDGEQVLALVGTGVGAPLISFSPATISFGNQGINTTSAPQTVTITNPGTGTNTLDGIYVSASVFGVFTITGGTCPMPAGPLASGASCTVLVAFAPTATGSSTGTLMVNNDVGSGTLTATTFSGTGVASVPGTAVPVISPAAGAYNAPVAVQITDATASAVIYETTDGTAPTTSSTAYTAPFTVAASSTQVQAIAAANGDTASAAATATYTVQPYLAFNTAAVGIAASSAQKLTATFSLLGTTAPTAALHYGKDYSLGAIACAPNGAIEVCTVPVTFAPTLPGARKDALFLKSGSTVLATVLLGGTGQAPFSLVQPGVITNPVLNGPSYIYGSTVDENGTVFFLESEANAVVSLTKAGVQTTLPITGLQGPSGIAVDGAGELYIAQNTYSKTLVTYNTLTGVQGSINVFPPAPYVSCSSTLLYPLSVAVDDIGNIFVLEILCGNVIEIKTDGKFVVTPIDPAMTQPSRIAVDALDTVFVSGYDINEIPATGTQTRINSVGGANGIQVDAAETAYASTYNNSAGTAELAASNYATPLASLDSNIGGNGEGLASDGTLFVGDVGSLDKVDRSQGAINFGEQQAGVASATQTVGIYNGGNQTLTLASFAIAGSGFSLSSPDDNACADGLTIAPGSLCNVNVTMTAPYPGVFSGTVTFTTNSLNTTTAQTVALSGFVYGAHLTAAPNPLNFGSLDTGVTSAPLLVTLTNGGDSQYAVIAFPSSTNPAFSVQPNTCAAVQLQVGSSCQLSVTFSPTAAQPYTGTVSVSYNGDGGGASQTVSITVNGSGIALAPAATPVISPGTGTYTTNQTVTITDSTAGATIYYSTDGSTPSTSSTKYTGSFVVSRTGTNVQAIAVASGYSQSPVALAVYDLKAVAPTFTPPGGTYTTSQNVVLNSTTAGASFYYTTNGQTPTTESTLYTGPIPVTVSGTTINAITSLSGYDISPVSSATYVIQPPAASFVSPVGTALPAQSVTVTLGDSGIDGIQVLTDGAANQDFTLAPGGTCQVGSVSSSCTVNVIFNPRFPGARNGAIVIDDGGEIASITYIAGTGIGPQVVFAPGVQSTLPSGNNGFNQPLGDAVDVAGNVYIADTLDNHIVQIPKTASGYGTPIVLPTSGLKSPSAVAIDGSGNLYIADTGNFSVEELFWDGTSYGNQTTLADGTLADVTGIAVDGNGDLFFTDALDNKLFEMPRTAFGIGAMVTVTQATGLHAPHGLAIDANQNIYIANSGEKTIVEVPVTSTGFGTAITLPLGSLELNYPQGVAVDGGGNVYIVDSSYNGVTRLPWSGTAFGTPVQFPLTGLGLGTGVAVDGAGSAYVVDATNNSALKLDFTVPPSLSFNSTNVGATSTDSPKTVIATNIGNDSLYLVAADANPTYPTNFPENTNDTLLCAEDSSVSQGQSCDVSVNFSPTVAGPLSGNVVLTDNSLNKNATQSIPVSGNGNAVGAPIATLIPSSLAFGSQVEYTTSATQTLTLTNSGNAALTGISIALSEQPIDSVAKQVRIGKAPGKTRANDSSVAGSADYNATTTCGATLAAGGSCTITVNFNPQALGPLPGTVTVSDNASSSPQTAALSGTGTAPAAPIATLTPASLAFGNQAVNTSSAAQTITLSNSGNAALTGIQIFLNENTAGEVRRIRSNGIGIIATNDFSATTTCGATLAAGASCTIAVTFTPTTEGLIIGNVTVDNDSSNPRQFVSLSGTGTAPAAAVVTLAPNTLSFGNQAIDTSSAPQTLTLSNSGNAAVNNIAIFLTESNGDVAHRIHTNGISIISSSNYAATTTCGTTLAAGSKCTIAVTFAPTSLGLIQGTLSISDDASSSPQSASLSGTGIAPALPSATLTPASLTFSSTTGIASAAQTATLKNTGAAPLAITSVSLTGTNLADFSQTDTCGDSLAAGASCAIAVTFKPAAAGSFTATLSVADNASGLPQTSALTGTGTAATGDFAVSSTTPSQTVTAGAAAAYNIVVATTPSGDVYNSAVTLSASGLPAGATVTFSPASVTPGSTSAKSTMTIQTAAGTAGATSATASADAKQPGSPWRIAAPGMAFLLGGFSLAFWRKRHRRSLRKLSGFSALLVLAALGLGSLAGSLALMGCGGGFALPKPVPVAKTYTVTVSGTSGEDMHTTTVTLTVN